MSQLSLRLASPYGLRWAQRRVEVHHYLRRPVDTRCSPLAYIVQRENVWVGCLIFGRPEATRCYNGGLTYGSVDDVRHGRARYSRWEILNLARVWLDPSIQQGGWDYVPNAATWVIGQALDRVVYDYLLHYPPCFLDEPWRIRQVLSYCDTRKHHGGLYRAAGFRRVRRNAEGIETWSRPVRGLQGHERKQIAQRAAQSQRSRQHRSLRAAVARQEVLFSEVTR